MKKFLAITAAFVCFFHGLVSAKEIAPLTVPFQNIFLNPKAKIQANYSFGGHPIIFCFENNLQNVGKISWTYKQKLVPALTLPIQLKTNSNFDGQFADPTGFITIENNTNIVLIVNCEFGF